MPLVVAANEIIIGGLSHSSSTAAWQSGWLFGDGAVAAAVTVATAVGVVFHPLATVDDEGAREQRGARCVRKSARGTQRTNERGGMREVVEEEKEEEG